MVDCFGSPRLDCLDERTKLIVRGYLRRSQVILSRSALNQIPNEIFIIALSFVYDHFMLYRGSFQWKITDSMMLERISSAQINQKFTSNIFEVGALSWVLNIFPNGHTSTATPLGNFMVFIQICSMPHSWMGITMLYTIQIEELNVNFVGIATYEDPSSYWGWVTDNLALNDVENADLKTMTITVSMKVLRILQKTDQKDEIVKFQSGIQNYKKHYSLKGTLKASPSIRRFSEIFGDAFCVYYDSPTSSIYLKLCGLPNKDNMPQGKNVNSLQVQWSIIIRECDFKYSSVDILEFDHSANSAGTLLPASFNGDDKNIEFEAFVEILTEYDFDANPIGCKVEEKWNDFITKSNDNDKKICSDKAKISSSPASMSPLSSQLHSMRKADLGTFSLFQMQQYVIGDLVKKEKEINQKLDQIMDRIGENDQDEPFNYEDNLCKIETEEKQEIDTNQEQKQDNNSLEFCEFKLWLENVVKLGQYLDVLVENGFDSLYAMTTTNIDQLTQIGIGKIGHAQTIMKHVDSIAFDDAAKMKSLCYYL